MFSPTLLNTLLLIPLVLVSYIVLLLLRLILTQYTTPLKHLPSPPCPSFFLGNLREMHDSCSTNLYDLWRMKYGSTFVYRGFLSGCRLITFDSRAISHILNRTDIFEKPGFIRDSLADMAAGKWGLLTVEGDMHKKQGPAFSASHIQTLSPVFWEKAVLLRSRWLDLLNSPSSTSLTPSSTSPSPSVAKITKVFDPLIPPPRLSDSPSAPFRSLICRFRIFEILAFVFGSKGEVQENGKIEDRNVYPGAEKDEREGKVIDILPWLGRATLDVIGEAGFGYKFNSLQVSSENENENELAKAFGIIFSTARSFRVWTILMVWVPFLRIFRWDNSTMRDARNTMRRIGMGLINDRKQESHQSTSFSPDSVTSSDPTPKRDLLSILVKSNYSEDSECSEAGETIDERQRRKKAGRMSMEEILCQISTFLAAGHETTSSAIVWTLYALAQNMSIQNELRERLRKDIIGCDIGGLGEVDLHPTTPPSLSTNTVPQNSSPPPLSPDCPSPASPSSPPCPDQETIDQILNHPYLDAVLRETLRLHAPVASTMRVAVKDDWIPLDEPVCFPHSSSSPSLSSSLSSSAESSDLGKELRVRVKKGDIITVPILEVNRDLQAWGSSGEDKVREIWPERWLSPQSGECDKDGKARVGTGAGGLWGGMLTFLGGPRACIGYRFALNEMKIFLYVLIRDLEFSMLPGVEIEKKVNIVTRPCVKSEPHKGNQMPLRVTVVPNEL
ncbi:Cytochrome P450 monooxygenase [Abortiporus biennis]